jgi:ribonuclease-3
MSTRRPIAGALRTPRVSGRSVQAMSRPPAPPPTAASKGVVTPIASRGTPARRTKDGSVHPATPFGYAFQDPALLDLALTHSSLAYETQHGAHDVGTDNERLEFIGDAVLGLAVAEALYRRFPDLREGELTRMRASLVSRRNLAEVAQRLALGPMLRLGRGEEHSGGHRKPALLADALEAVIAAIYLDGGLSPASAFIHQHIIDPAEPALAGLLLGSIPIAGAIGDFKSALQEKLQATGAGQPHYILTEESGPDHQKRFRIQVRIDGPDGASIPLAEAEGTTKKQAQQEAARLALAVMNQGSVTEAAR